MAWLMGKESLIMSNTTCTKKFWKTNLEKDLLNIKCISNTIKYKKIILMYFYIKNYFKK